MKWKLQVALLLTSVLFSFQVSAQSFTLGIVPQQSAKKLARLWTPIVKYLSEKTGHDIRFATAHNIPTFEERLLKGEYDIAYMNPYHYTVFHQKPGYRAIAKQPNKKIKGIIVVPKDSKIESLEELNNSKMAFPSPAAFAASVIPRAQLTKQNIAIEESYVSSHDSVYLGVAKGFFKAGGGVKRTLNNTDPKIKEQLKILWTTNGYTPHAIAVGPDVDAQVAQSIQQALLSMNDTEEGRKLLKSINFNGMAVASNEEWDDVRALDIKLLEHMLQP